MYYVAFHEKWGEIFTKVAPFFRTNKSPERLFIDK